MKIEYRIRDENRIISKRSLGSLSFDVIHNHIYICLFEGKPTDYTNDSMNNSANTGRMNYSNKQLTV